MERIGEDDRAGKFGDTKFIVTTVLIAAAFRQILGRPSVFDGAGHSGTDRFVPLIKGLNERILRHSLLRATARTYGRTVFGSRSAKSSA